ncbi:hypothetical protein [Paenibacillus flagellatus]|uniref:Uncharacterized protein n=1 Tax=Paenibacillus flagellatus TaxID=2211139 RepID=A0A2V5K2B0_9BACL|nr:hypothetical protein [Paenibacillus flagellatus]PYI53385.1 hypothetical protein DLM86_16510 [Paenibacillus flagellatus]
MDRKQMEEQIIRNYERDEHMMVLVFAQWCVNRGLDPEELYKRAYPDQAANDVLRQAIELTVPKEEAGDIPDETVLGVLSLFGNEELAFVVTEEIAKGGKGRR